ncbi:MAG: hypothetical protein AVDCRST_MAG23-2646, partial [uncultured Sphingosinicella sp.]
GAGSRHAGRQLLREGSRGRADRPRLQPRDRGLARASGHSPRLLVLGHAHQRALQGQSNGRPPPPGGRDRTRYVRQVARALARDRTRHPRRCGCRRGHREGRAHRRKPQARTLFPARSRIAPSRCL